MDFSDWDRTSVNPLSVLLDDENPRLDARDLEQSQIRRLLLEHEDVARLAHKIVQTGDVYPHDLLVVGATDKGLTVFEGNRRISALQMLLNPNLIPDEFRDRLPRIDAELKDRFSQIAAVVAPDRRSAQHLIAQIHAFNARKNWSPLAKYRYAHLRLEEGQSLQETAADLGTDASEVRRFIRRYNMYRELLRLSWSAEELQVLRGEDLTITPYIYPFERNNIREMVGEVFDAEGKRTNHHKKGVADRFLKALGKDALIALSGTGKPRLSTRGTDSESLEDYFRNNHQEIIAEEARMRAAADAPKSPPPPPSPPPPAPPPPPPPPKPTPKPDEFFESFSVPATLDQKFISLAWEISHIDYGRYPLAAGMLLRSLLEETLRTHLQKIGRFSEYKKASGSDGRDSLKSMILFCAEKKNAVFGDKKTAEQLSRFQNSAVKDDLDNIVHSRHGAMNKQGLQTIKPWVRPIIESIVKDEWA